MLHAVSFALRDDITVGRHAHAPRDKDDTSLLAVHLAKALLLTVFGAAWSLAHTGLVYLIQPVQTRMMAAVALLVGLLLAVVL